ncbi:muscleblind-like protein 2a isoform X2 [Watersipora subatra]|uniref:muscleblind-like protein 2a isoform X2 n=1 Tax=Watersipora subatra TaxID=2589382 RepID=UPI00355C5974
MVSGTELTPTSPKPENPYVMTTQAALPQAALLFNNSKDSRWLTLEVCREFQRNRCTRTEEECKFAHPPPHVDQQNGRVMCCFDSIKGKCQRKEPPCKYLHPPQHLKEQLLQNGRQNLAIKYHWNQVLAQNQIAAQMPTAAPLMPSMTGIPGMPGMAGPIPSPYLYNQYPGMPGAPMPAGIGQLPLQFAVSQALAQIPSSSASSTTPTANGQKAPRADRLEVCTEFSKDGSCPVPESECDKAHPPDYVLTENDLAIVCMDFVKGKCSREHCKYYHPTAKLLARVNQNRAAVAAVNQANTHAAQQALSQVLAAAALHQPPAVQTPQSLLGLGHGHSASVAPAAALSAAVSQASQAQMNPYGVYHNALGMHAGLGAGLTGAYQSGLANPMASAGQLSAAAAGSATGASLQAAAASAASPDSVLSQQQQQAKKRPRDDELLLSMQGMPGVGIPMKRPALDAKGGLVFNPAAYPQFAYAQQQPTYVPSVSSAQVASSPYQLLSNGTAGGSVNGDQSTAAGPAPRIQLMSNNVDNVNYYDDNSQLLDTLPVCRDYRSGQCNRPTCKYIHLLDDHVEVSDGKVTVCRDNVKNKCLRSNCKYFHLPWYVLLRPTQNQ